MNKNFFEAGQKLACVFAKTLNEVKPGVKLADIEKKAVSFIHQEGGKPGFKMVENYNWATCINLNQGVVHGIPDEKKISHGDVVSLDIGLYYNGWHADMAYTKLVKNGGLKVKSENKNKEFLEAGENALEEAIKQVKPGNRVGHISRKIEKIIKRQGYDIFHRLTGHGIGKELHQAPYIPGELNQPIKKTPLLKPGMGLAIEVIYTYGKGELKTARDGWTLVTRDGKISALFEKTVLVTNNSAKIITPYLFSGGN